MTSTKTKLTAILYKLQDPFKDYEWSELDCDPQGWNSNHEFLTDAVKKKDELIIVETGVWKGKSAMHMARAMKEQGVDGCVICIDTFLGCHVLWQVVEWQSSMKRTAQGRPEYWKTFYANVMKEGLQDYILPIHLDTLSGFRLLKEKGIKVDAIHHDASHQSPDVFNDLTVGWEILKEGGAIIVDDYCHMNLPVGHHNNFDDLIDDVNQFAESKGKQLDIKEPKARIFK